MSHHIGDMEQVVHGAVARNRYNMRCLLGVGSFKIPQKPVTTSPVRGIQHAGQPVIDKE